MATPPFTPADLLAHLLGDGLRAEVTELHMDARDLQAQGWPAFSSLHGLQDLPALERLSVMQHALPSLEGLGHLPRLHTLVLAVNQISSLSEVQGCPALTELDVTLNQLQTLEDMPTLPHLRRLMAGHNQLRSLRHAPQLPALVSATLSGTALASLEGVEAWPALEELFLLSCPHLRMPAWDALPALHTLRISTHHSDQVSALASRLRHLTLDLTAGGPQRLASWPLLESLEVKAMRTSETLLLTLEDMPALASLHLAARTVPEIRSGTLPGLKSLRLSPAVDPAELPWHRWPALRQLTVPAVRWTAEVKQQVMRLFPDLNVTLG